jgi:penicillin-binding protein 1A
MLLAIAAVAIAAGVMYAQVSSTLPDPTHQLKGIDQTTKVFDRKGRLIADLFAEQNRTSVPLDKMPATLRQAVIATEDERYYQHAGVDPLGIARALVTDIRKGDKAQGGSTITQQYVKNAFVGPERTLRRKISEALLAYRVEKNYTKDQILEMYLNTIYFGHGAYGVQTAAQVYFGKRIDALDTAESAMLAGVIKSPGRYSPYIDLEAAKGRRSVVLQQMLNQGYISAAALASSDEQPVKLTGLRRKSRVAPYFMEYVKNLLVEQFGSEAVYRGGLRVETSLDLSMQTEAEDAIHAALDREDDPSAALVSIEPTSGEIRAMVGGREFDSQQFNVAVQGRRQPGSAFKPFVLVAALTDKVSPEQTYECGAVELSTGDGPVWKVTGAGGDRSGPMRLREATERSVNSVFAQLILQIGPDKVAAAAKRLGVVTPVRPLPAIALGGLEQGVTPLEMTAAYAALANGGVRTQPHGIMRVEDGAGKVLFSAKREATRVISPAVAYLTTDMLKGVITRGTGKAADIDRPAAGKTGTTQAYRDAWFAGYTPQLATVVWVGFPDTQREMTSVHDRKVTGGSFPAEIWQRFMERSLKGISALDFPEPDGLARMSTCLDTGMAATTACPNKADELFLDGETPKPCTTHVPPKPQSVPKVTGLTKDAATSAILKAGFTVLIVERPSDTVPAGLVVSQDPAANTSAAPKANVSIVVSTGLPASGADTGNPVARPEAPVAVISASDRSPKKGVPVTFDGSASHGDIVALTWDFGDGRTGRGVNVRHAFSRKGTFTVRLTVTARDGGTATVTRKFTVG